MNKISPKKKYWISAAAIAGTLLITAFLFMINDIMISIRLRELQASLREIDRGEASIDHISLVATYEIHKKLFENRITQDSADALELKLLSLRINDKDNHTRMDSLQDWLITPALGLMNFNRMVLGKMPINYHDSDNAGGTDLDLAYYYERNMHFEKAAGLYEKSLAAVNIPDSIRAGVLLHQGYCYALADLDIKARENYMKILEDYAKENSAITAAILLQYLDGFTTARRKVLAGGGEPLAQSRQLVNLLAYRQALEILETSEKTAKPGSIDSIRYFKARCYAGLGNTQRAAEKYLQVILSSPSSPYAKYSNRKLFMLGTEGENNLILKTSIKLNERLNDPVLARMISETGETPQSGPAVKLPITIIIPQDLHEGIEKISRAQGAAGHKIGEHIVVYTSDGNRFKGILLEDSPGHISLETSVGTINVKKDRIARISDK